MSMSRTWVAASAAVVLIGATPGCRGDQGGGALHAQQASLEREVGGLRERVGKLERGEPILPEQAVVAAISDAVVRDFLTAQMPFDLEVQSFRISLTQAEAAFQGSPSVSLTGTIAHREHPGLVGEVRALGALDEIKVDPASGLLEAKVVVDHIDLLQMAGLEKYLSGATVDELARTVRQQLAGKIPTVQIPIGLPDVTEGPVRLQGATMPLKVGVADVFAGQGVLWVAIDVVPGDLVRKAPAGPVKEAPAKAEKAPAAAPANGEQR